MLLKRIKKDNGAIGTVEFLLLFTLIIFLLLIIIDFGLMFSNKVVITNAVQNGARLVAVYGGENDTKISREYGAKTVTTACTKFNATGNGSCAVANELANGGLNSQVTIKKIQCGPGKARLIGERTWCSVDWEFKTISGIIQFGPQQSKASAESEVVFR